MSHDADQDIQQQNSPKRDKVDALKPEKMQSEVTKATEYMQGLVPLLRPNAGPWMFGTQRPTAMDAHLVVMIARLQNVGRDSIIPDKLKAYADLAMRSPEWIEVMTRDEQCMMDQGLPAKT
jgi:hypothetical protein